MGLRARQTWAVLPACVALDAGGICSEPVSVSCEYCENLKKAMYAKGSVKGLTGDVSIFTYVTNHQPQALMSAKIPWSIMC